MTGKTGPCSWSWASAVLTHPRPDLLPLGEDEWDRAGWLWVLAPFSTAGWPILWLFHKSINRAQWAKKGLKRKSGLHTFLILWAWISFTEQLSSQPTKQVCLGLLIIPTAVVHVSSVTAARWKSKWIALQMRHFSALTFQTWQWCLFSQSATFKDVRKLWCHWVAHGAVSKRKKKSEKSAWQFLSQLCSDLCPLVLPPNWTAKYH